MVSAPLGNGRTSEDAHGLARSRRFRRSRRPRGTARSASRSPAARPGRPRGPRSRPWRTRRRAAGSTCGEILRQHAAPRRDRAPRVSASSGTSPCVTRARASATESRAMGDHAYRQRGLERAGPAAGLLHEANTGERHRPIDRLAHIVDGEAGDRDRGQRLHLHSGLGLDLGGRFHASSPADRATAQTRPSPPTGGGHGRAGSAHASAWPP